MKDIISNDVAKEIIILLSYCDDVFVNKIPDSVLNSLNNKAANSLKKVYINEKKSLIDQDVSDECRDLLGMLFFLYGMSDDEKKEVLNMLLNNF